MAFASTLVVVSALSIPAAASDPVMFGNGEVFVSAGALCNPKEGEDAYPDRVAAKMNRNGIFASMWSCRFVQALPVRGIDETDDEIFGWIVLASCGAENTPTRPDTLNINILKRGKRMVVTSQNDFQTDTYYRMQNQSPESEELMIDRKFDLCEK